MLEELSSTWSRHRRAPDDVSVRDRNSRRGRTLEVRVHPDDLGKVIGRGGRTAKALRTVIGALAPAAASGSTSSTSTSAEPLASTGSGGCRGRAVGRIGRPHGIAGEVTVEVRTDDPDRRLAPGTRVRTDPAARRPAHHRGTAACTAGRLLLRFDGVADRTGAEALRGVLLVADVDADERPDDPDEFYDHQLVGLACVTVDRRGRRRGRRGAAPARAGRPRR